MLKHLSALVLLAALATPGFAARSAFDGTVVGVSDGDTLTVLHDEVSTRVRLMEIDAPEKKQPFGAASKKSLSDLCFSKPAHVEVSGLDRYGRTLGRVFCAGVDSSTHQLQSGLAWAYEGYAKEPNSFVLQDSARLSGLGLWADPAPMRPWEFRKIKK